MGYKTFEDMKHNIPEGATHYHNESDGYHFCWFKVDGNKWFVNCPDKNEKWYTCYREQYRDGIVQFIQTESPQEREALDMIDTTSKQVESLANNSESPYSSEWKNGDECVYMTHNVVHQFIGPCPKREGYGYIQAPGFEVNFVELSKLSKPESPERKVERERLEAAYDLYCLFAGDGEFLSYKYKYHEFDRMNDFKNKWLTIVDKTNYRKQQKDEQ